MGYGVQFPLRITARGGLATSQDNLLTVLGLSLLPGQSGNPYNDRDGVGQDELTWEATSAESEAVLRARIRRRFDILERLGRARLDRIERRLDYDAVDDGVFDLRIHWFNLETGTSETTVLPSQT